LEAVFFFNMAALGLWACCSYNLVIARQERLFFYIASAFSWLFLF